MIMAKISYNASNCEKQKKIASFSPGKTLLLVINLSPGNQILDERRHFAHSSLKTLFLGFLCLPPCSAGKTLTTFEIAIDKHFAALLSKIWTY